MASPDRLAEIKARWATATPGPWRWGDWGATFGQPERERQRLEHSPNHGDFPAPARLREADSIAVLPGLEDSIELGSELEANAQAIAHAPTDIDWLLGEVERLREEREAIFRRSNAVFESKDQQIKEWRQAAGAEANLADERCHEVERLREGIKAALDCHTETARRVTLQELLDPRNANE